jgi:hypothetical protein
MKMICIVRATAVRFNRRRITLHDIARNRPQVGAENDRRSQTNGDD